MTTLLLDQKVNHVEVEDLPVGLASILDDKQMAELAKSFVRFSRTHKFKTFSEAKRRWLDRREAAGVLRDPTADEGAPLTRSGITLELEELLRGCWERYVPHQRRRRSA